MANFLTIGTSGPSDARVMIVGEAPGADELRFGTPFVGYSGKVLRDTMQAAGLDPEKCFFTNLCRYRPPGNELGAFFSSDGVPNEKVIEGLTLLKQDIDRVRPNIIIALGAFPLHFLTGRGRWSKKDRAYTGIGDYRGYILDGQAIAAGVKVIASYHPAAITRKYSWKHLLRFDLQRSAREQGFPEIRRPRRHVVVVEPDDPNKDAWVRWLAGPDGVPAPVSDEVREVLGGPSLSDSFLSSDIEYIGARLLCTGFTRSSRIACVFPTRTSTDRDLVQSIIECGVPLCLQNAMFDCSILEWHFGFQCLRYLAHDTMIAMHCAYTEFPKDLGFIGSLQTEWEPWWEEINGDFWKAVKKAIEAGDQNVLELLESRYLPYNGGDVCVTHEAMKAMLADELTDPNVQASYLHEMSLVRPLWEIGKRGVPIDQAALSTLRSTLESEALTLSAGVALMNGGSQVNVKAPQQVAAFIYETMQFPKVGARTKPSSRFPTGQWKMDDTTLADLSLKAKNDRQRTAIRLVRDARERLDLISKFCNIELDSDFRMRCHYDPAKTDTGRLSSRTFYPTGNGANLQNVPRDPRVRAVFIPDPGYTFGYADLKSAESLVVAHITGDPEMLRLHSPEYMSGSLDGHKYVASFLLEKPIELITKDERYLGKRCRHAGNYGLGWFKLMQLINADAQKTGVSIDAARAKHLIARYRQLHPFLANWWSDVLGKLWDTHTLYTHHGRKRVFYGRPDEILPEGIAYDPQGTVAQTLNMGLLRMEPMYHVNEEHWQRQWDSAQYGMQEIDEFIEKSMHLTELGFQMLLQVHDAVGFQIPTENVQEAMPLVRDLMSIPILIKRRGIDPYEITIPVEIQLGANWGESDLEEAKKKGKPPTNPQGLVAWHG